MPVAAVALSRTYRNLFVELGKTPAEVDERVDAVVNQLYYGGEDEKLYYESGSDEAYFYTADTDDVRSEGMSYGMMFSVQLGKHQEFDRLWKFAKTHMQHQTGDRTGYFAWRVRTDGTQLDANPAPDGEEYFAMSLLMASRRWGSTTGIYDYESEANLILDHMLNHRALIGLPEFSGIANMIDPVENQVVFSIEGQSATFTDPSYHLPHFYELFARWAAKDSERWLAVADESRQLFRDATHEVTGLAADYTLFDGTPTGGTHAQFRFDAWRVAMNIALDSSWWNRDPWQRDTWVKNYLGFFVSQGVSSYKNQFNVDGTGAEGDHSPGLVAMNAVAALISEEDLAWELVTELWEAAPTSGKRHALYEPVHGSAPEIAGKGIANPIAMIASLGMALRYSFDMAAEADLVDRAIAAVLDDGIRTQDIKGSSDVTVSTAQMGDAIKEKLTKLAA